MVWRYFAGCLIVALGACTSSPPTSAPPTAPRSVVAMVTGYYRAIVTRNYHKAFGYLASGATGPDGHSLTLGSFLQLAHMLDGMGGPVTRFSVGVSPSGVVMTLYRVRYGPYHAHLQVVRVREGWSISSIDRI